MMLASGIGFVPIGSKIACILLILDLWNLMPWKFRTLMIRRIGNWQNLNTGSDRNMENRIIIRADGGRSLGLGHWSRCLFLLSCFKNISPDLSCVFFTRNLQALSESFPDERLEIVQLENEEELVKSVNSKDIILIDLYHFEPEYLRQLKGKNAFIIFVDDLLSPCIEA